MNKLTIYQKPTCTTCRTVMKLLQESGVDFDAINYYIEPIPKSKLRGLLKKMRMRPHEFLRTNEPIYKKLGLGAKRLSDEQLLDLMVKYPDLIQRPIIEYGERAILARPPERVREILS
jgi:arsenate reductase